MLFSFNYSRENLTTKSKLVLNNFILTRVLFKVVTVSPISCWLRMFINSALMTVCSLSTMRSISSWDRTKLLTMKLTILFTFSTHSRLTLFTWSNLNILFFVKDYMQNNGNWQPLLRITNCLSLMRSATIMRKTTSTISSRKGLNFTLIWGLNSLLALS